MFSGCTVPPDCKETELGSRLLHQQVKMCHVAYGSVSLQVLLVVWIFLTSLGVIYYNRWVLSEGHKKLLQGLVSDELTAYVSVFNLFLTQWIIAILSKGCKPDNFESHNSLKLSFTNIWGLHSNFVECESFLESNSPDILALCETNLDDSIDSGNFSVRGYLPLIRKDSSTHMHGLAVYVKEGLPFAPDLSLENYADSYLCFRQALLYKCLTSFSSIDHLLRRYARFLILFHLR